MKTWIIAAMVITGVAATVRAEEPSPAQKRVDAAKAELTRIKADIRKQWEDSQEYKDLKADLSAKRAAAQTARTVEAERASNMAATKLATAQLRAMSPTPEQRAAEQAVKDAEADLLVSYAEERQRDKVAAAQAVKDKMAEAAKSAPAVSLKRIQTLGERYTGTLVKLSGVEFVEADNQWARLLPGIKLLGTTLKTDLYKGRAENWIGVRVRDESGSSPFIFASKEVLADFVLGIKPGERIDIYGFVVELRHPGWYGVVCYRVDTARGHSPSSEQQDQWQ